MLPESWVLTRIGDVLKVTVGSTPSRSRPDFWDGDIPWVSSGEVAFCRIRKTKEAITRTGFERSSVQLLPPGTVLVGMIGEGKTRGQAAVLDIWATNNQNSAAIGTGADGGPVVPEYLYYLLVSQYQENRQVGSGNNQPALNKARVEAIPLPLAPLTEQARIVAEIEKQFTRLDTAVAGLKRAQANLTRYRAAVLKAACEGRLVPTEAELARAEGREYEDGSVLLQRILRERRVKWEEEQLAKIRATGKEPKDDKWRVRYEQPSPTKTPNLARLPEGWAWTTVEQLNPANRPCAYGVLQPGPDIATGVRLVRVGDIADGRIDVMKLKQIRSSIAAQYPRTTLVGDEVLLTIVGTIGRTAVVPKALAGANVARAVAVIPLPPQVSPHWVELWFRNPAKSREMTGLAHEVARKTLNLEDVRAARVALPPRFEQDRIVEEAERLLTNASRVEESLKASLVRVERLRQSILKRAFEGKLVAQDPADEPASVLLERIRAEREADGGVVKGRSRSASRKGKGAGTVLQSPPEARAEWNGTPSAPSSLDVRQSATQAEGYLRSVRIE